MTITLLRGGWVANGAAASLTANAPSYWAQPALWETEVWGTEGMLRIGRGGVEISSNKLSAINEDAKPVVTARDGLESLRVVMALYESVEMGEIVSPPSGSSISFRMPCRP